MTSNPLPIRRRGIARRLFRLAIFPLSLAAYIAILFEEWLWRHAKSAMARLGAHPWMRKAERSLASAPPWAAACAFIIPGAILFPFKLAALYLIAHHHAALGATVFVAAKFAGAAALARVWTLTEPSLRSISWISVSVDWILAKKNQFKAWMMSLWAMRVARGWLGQAKFGARSIRSRIAGKLWSRAMAKARAQAPSPSERP